MTVQTKIEPEPLQRLELALAEALPKLEAARKNSENPGFKQGGKAIKYADLGAVIDAIRPLAEYGIWYRQVLHEGPEGVTIETLYTGFGVTISAGTLFMPAAKRDPQGFGSALSYARRYGLQTAFGLATEDDDGNAASKAPQPGHVPQRLDDATLTKIIALCEALGGNQPGIICKAYQIDALPELTPSQATAVVNRLNEKLADAAKAESNKEAAHV